MKSAARSFGSVLLVLGASLGALPVPASGPYYILRSNSAATIEGAAPAATVATSPFDDAPGLLDDGALYFYAVADAGNARIEISAHKNEALRTVRISFDDGNPLSGPVDPSLSTVEAAPSTAPADGVSVIEITIVPRDANGTPLGAGLDVTIDLGALWPAELAGPVVDNGDGTYSVRVVSTIPGTAELSVVVEGVSLVTRPELTFEDTGPATLRELAIRRLESLTASEGWFEQLLDGLDPSLAPGAQIASALDEVLGGLSDLYAYDDGHAKGRLKSAIDDLVSTLGNPAVDDAEIVALIGHVLDSARMLAVYHINEAEEACGACGQGGPTAICQARQALQNGDDVRQASPPDYKKAAANYGAAMDKAITACP